MSLDASTQKEAGHWFDVAGIALTVGALVVLTLGLTVVAGPAFDLSKRAAAQLLNPDEYVRAVLGGRE